MLKELLKDYSYNIQRGDIIDTERGSFIVMDISAFSSAGERYALVGLIGEFAGRICKLFPQKALSIECGIDIQWFKENIFLFTGFKSEQVYITAKPRPQDLIF